MEHEDFVKQHNKIRKLKCEEEKRITDRFKEYKEIKNIVFKKDEIETDLNYVVKMLLQQLEDEKKFKFDSTWVGRGVEGKLIIKDGMVCFRPYKHRDCNIIDFFGSHPESEYVLNLLDDNFGKMIREIAKKIDIFETAFKKEYTEKTDASYVHSRRNIKLTEQIVGIKVFKRHGWSEEEEGYQLEIIKKITSHYKLIDINSDRIEYVLTFYNANHDLIEQDGLLFHTNKEVLKLYDRMFELFDKNSKRLGEKVKKQYIKIYDIMEKYGYKEYLALRGI